MLFYNRKFEHKFQSKRRKNTYHFGLEQTFNFIF